MKKLLGILAITALATSGFAQGTVVFANSASTGPVKQWTSASDPTAIVVPKSGGRVELIAGPTTSTLAHNMFSSVTGGVAANYSSLSAFLAANPGWTDIASTPITSLSAGQFGGGTVTIASIGAGANANYFILGWTGTAATFDAALASGTAFMGQSSVFPTATGNPNSSPPGTPVNLNATFTGMTLAPLSVIPEPSTFALAGLGAAALLILRRRK